MSPTVAFSGLLTLFTTPFSAMQVSSDDLSSFASAIVSVDRVMYWSTTVRDMPQLLGNSPEGAVGVATGMYGCGCGDFSSPKVEGRR